MPDGFHNLDQTKTNSTSPEKPIHNSIYCATMTSLEMHTSTRVDRRSAVRLCDLERTIS